MTPDQQAVAQQATRPVAPSVPSPKSATGIKLPKLGFWNILRIVVFAILILWTVINIALFWSSGINPSNIVSALWWPGIFFVQFALLTTPWRAVTVKEMGRMFLIGMGIVFFGVIIGESVMVSVITAFPDFNPIYWFLRLDFVLGRPNFMADVASPIVEEVLKILPVVIFLVVAKRGYWKRSLGPLDVGLLGGACGAGYLFMENLAKEGAGYWSTIGPGRSVREASFGIDPFFLFPDMYHGNVSIWPGHAETAMLIGLCLGFGLLLRKKLPVIWAAIPIVGLLWMIWLHFMINYLESDNRQFWAQIVMGLHLNGGLFQYVMILGLLLALAVSMITKMLYLSKDKNATVMVVGKETLEYIKANQKEPLLIVKKLWSLRHFWTFRHAVAYGVLYAQQQKPVEQEKWLPWLHSLRQSALGKQ